MHLFNCRTFMCVLNGSFKFSHSYISYGDHSFNLVKQLGLDLFSHKNNKFSL